MFIDACGYKMRGYREWLISSQHDLQWGWLNLHYIETLALKEVVLERQGWGMCRLMSFLLYFTIYVYFLSLRNVRRWLSICSHPSCGRDTNIKLTERSVPNIHGGLGMPHLENHKFASRLAFLHYTLTGDSILAGSVRAAFPYITITSPVSRAECHHKSQDQSRFLSDCQSALRVIPQSSDLSWFRRINYHELVERVMKDRLCAHQQTSFTCLVLGVSGALPYQLWVFASLVTGSE